MSHSKELRAAANRILQEWWKVDTTFGFTNFTPEIIAQGAATLKPLATGEVLCDIEGIEMQLDDLNKCVANGEASQAARLGIQTGGSFFKLIADIAARNRGEGQREEGVCEYVRKENKRNPKELQKLIVDNAISAYLNDFPRAKRPDSAALQKRFKRIVSRHNGQIGDITVK
jgi:hypothetical protein